MEKRKERNGFQFDLRQAPDRTEDFLARFLLGLATLLAIYGCLWNGLSLSGGSYSFAILGIVGALFCLASCGLPQKWKLAQYAALVVLAVYAVVVSRWLIDGWNITLNQIFAGLEVHLGRIFPRYTVGVDPNMRPVCATLFLAMPAAMLGFAAGWSAKGKLPVLLAVDGLVLAASLLGLYTPNAWTVLLALVTAAVCARRVTSRNNGSDRGGMIFWLLAMMVLLTAASLLPPFFAGDGTAQAQVRRLEASRQIYALRYEQSKQMLPRGDFSRLGDFSSDADKTVMTVTLPKPVDLYLRGFVGERYTGDGWAGLPPAQKAQSAMEFSWLHDRGFYGQNQIAQLADVLNMETSIQKISVDNKTAEAGSVYAPYELKTGNPDAAGIGDANLPADGLRGQRQYDYFVTDRSAADYEQLYTKLTDAWHNGDKDATEYLKSENIYRKYVYANDLDAAPAAEAVRTLLGGRTVPEGGLSFSAAQQVVRSCLSTALAYNETPPSYTGGDFMNFLVNDSRKGYSVHYATAATLLFRSLGIPARYVEGYYISADETAAAVAKEEPVRVTETNAHAWVEIYRDGVGFIPFEITPSDSSSTDQSQSQNNAGGAAPVPKLPQPPINLLGILLWLLAGILALAALLFLALVLRRLWLRRRWKRLLEGCSPDQAVELWTAYSVRLLGSMGVRYRNGSLYRLKGAITDTLGQETAEAFADVVSIQQQARFSPLSVKDHERGTVSDFAGGMTQKLKKHCKWPLRFRLRYLDCLI